MLFIHCNVKKTLQSEFSRHCTNKAKHLSSSSLSSADVVGLQLPECQASILVEESSGGSSDTSGGGQTGESCNKQSDHWLAGSKQTQ